jgi:hypothetical protein
VCHNEHQYFEYLIIRVPFPVLLPALREGRNYKIFIKTTLKRDQLSQIRPGVPGSMSRPGASIDKKTLNLYFILVNDFIEEKKTIEK